MSKEEIKIIAKEILDEILWDSYEEEWCLQDNNTKDKINNLITYILNME